MAGYVNPFAPAAKPQSAGTQSMPTTGYINPFAPKTIAPTATTAPKTAMSGSLGGGYGTSNITDTSGKPLLTYENQKAQSSQLLSDRTAPGFDPTVAQKVDPATLQDPRMKESVSQQLKSQLGGSTFNELDHIMPLELGGSNNQSNLRLESGKDIVLPYSPGKNPTPTDPLENQLATKVHNGDISLADSWKLMAQAKGIVLPEQGGAVPTLGQFPAKPKTLSTQEAAQAVALNFFPGTMQSLSDLQLDPLSLKAEPSKALSDRAKSMGTAIGQEYENIVNFFKSLDSSKTPADRISAGTNVAIGAVNVGISPLTSLFAAANDIPVLGSVSRLVAVFFNALGEGVNLTAHAIAAQTIQKIPGLSQDSKDKITDAYAKINSIAYQFGVPMAAEDIAGLKARLIPKFGEQDAQTIINAGKNLAEGKDILAKPTLSDIADKPEVKPIELPKTSEDAASRYSKEVIESKKSSGQAVVIGADDIKDHFGKDYSPERHAIYSEAANKIFNQEVKSSPESVVKMVVGGTGSGKTDFVVPDLSDNFKGVIYDSTGWNYDGFKKQIQEAESNGKKVEIYGTIPNLESAKAYTHLREAEGGHPVSDSAFNRTHAGAIETLISAVKDGADVYINDSSNSITPEWKQADLAELEKLRYTEDEVAQRTKHVTKENAKSIIENKTLQRGGEEGVSGISKKNGTDKGIIREKAGSESGEKEVRPSSVKVSRSQLPVGEGETKTSGLEARMKASLDNLSEEDKGNISNYSEMNNKQQLKAAADYVAKNPDEAMEVLKGNKPAPKGLLTNAIYLALKESGKGDPELALKLASLRSTRMGQEIQILSHADPYSPDTYIKSIQDSRIEALGREKVKTMINQEVSKASDYVKRATADRMSGKVKMDWNSFVDSITC